MEGVGGGGSSTRIIQARLALIHSDEDINMERSARPGLGGGGTALLSLTA